MASIMIQLDSVLLANDQLTFSRNHVSSALLGMVGLSWQIDGEICNRRNISSRISSYRAKIQIIENVLGDIKQVTTNGVTQYKSTDDFLSGKGVSGGVGALLANGVNNSKFPDAPKSSWEKFFDGKLKVEDSGSLVDAEFDFGGFGSLAVGLGNAGYEAGVKPKYGEYESQPKKVVKKDNKTYQSYVYDQQTGQYSMPDLAEYAKKSATVFEVAASASANASLLSEEYKLKGENGELSASAKVCEAEAHASVSAGLYVYGKDGKQKLAPSVNAEVGASFSALAVEAEGRYGLGGAENNLIGVYGSAEAAAGKVEAKAKVTGSVFDQNGSLNIQAKASASAEAIAVEAKGSAGVTVLGTDLGVTGSVNIGIGAHADVGIIDGKVKVDIGASLGVGVSVGFEVDVSGTVDAVCDGAKSAWNEVTSWF